MKIHPPKKVGIYDFERKDQGHVITLSDPVFNVFIPLETLEKQSDVSVRNMSPTVGPQLGTPFRNFIVTVRNMSLSA